MKDNPWLSKDEAENQVKDVLEVAEESLKDEAKLDYEFHLTVGVGGAVTSKEDVVSALKAIKNYLAQSAEGWNVKTMIMVRSSDQAGRDMQQSFKKKIETRLKLHKASAEGQSAAAKAAQEKIAELKANAKS